MLQESINSVNHDAGGSNVVPLRPVAEHKQQARGGVVKADLDDGYLRLSNTLVDALCRTKLSDRESRVVFAVIRRTYGYGKATDWVCLEQLADMTGITTSNICHAIKSLTARDIIIKDGRKVGVNPIVSAWQDKKSHSINGKKSTIKTDNIIVDSDNAIVETDSVGCQNREIQKKDTNTKEIQKISSSNIAVAMTDKPLKPDAAVQTPNGKLWGTQDDLTCAEYIFNKVLIVNPTAKQPNWPDWANQVRLMRVQDQRTHHEICKLFKFANSDSFWASNVLCPKTLRKQWDRLTVQLSARTSHETTANDSAGHGQRYENPTARVFRELREMAEQLEQSTDHHCGGHTIDADYEPVQS
ncbi:replication protein [Shewanella sp. SM87]|uniref:replication protein n=1 Tax=Shewanella sp. SM87 TaxID=2912808 RepID=UPI0021D9B5FA|nr:replication protein [Shewanella sp. SM87]MCU8008477.1 replication protein [Shewanella sp. SM87]